MRRDLKYYLKIIAIPVLLVLVGLFFILNIIYTDSLKLVNEQFNERQAVLAQHTVIGIDTNIKALARELELASKKAVVRSWDLIETRKMMEEIFEHANSLQVNDMGLIDSDGILTIALKASQLEGVDFSFREYYKQAKELKESFPTYEFIEFKGVDIGRQGIVIGMPVFSYNDDFLGVLIFTIKVDDFIASVKPADLTGSQYWVMDDDGRILFHPEYPAGTNIEQFPDLDISFKQFLENIKINKAYKAEYISPGGIQMVAASYSFKMINKTWSIVIDTPEENVISLLVAFTTTHALVTLGILLLVITISFIVIYLVNKAINRDLLQEIADRKKAQETLKESEEKYRKLIETANDAIFIVDIETSKIIDVNKKAEKLIGRPQKEIIGMYQFELHPKEDSEKYRKIFKDHIQKKEAIMTDLFVVHKDGHKIPIEISSSVVDVGGRKIIQGLFRDITERKKAEKELRELNLFNQTLLDSFPFGMDVVDENGCVLFMSKKLENIFGKKSIGKKCWNLYKDNKQQCDNCPLKKGIKIGETSDLETEGCLNGKILRITHVGMMYKKQKAVLEIFQDITDRKKAEEQIKQINQKLKESNKLLKTEKSNVAYERNRLDVIIQSIGDGVFVVDKNYKIIIFNEMASKISGFSEKEAIGKRYDEVLKFVFEKENKINDEFIKKSMKSGNISLMTNHTLLIKKDGTKVPVADSAAPLKDKNGNVIGCAIVFRDVTKEREIDRAKTEFVSLASHQLRTPLTSINWYTELLLSGHIGKFTKEQKKYLGEVYHGNQRMIKLVNAILNVSRIETGTLAIESEPTNLINLANSVWDDLSLQIKQRKIVVNKSYPSSLPKINVDRKLMRVVFANLFSNSIKYTPTKGHINLEMKKRKTDVLISLSDNGYGIPKNDQSKIFTKLFRADNVKGKDPDGTGLGLYIVKSVIEQSGGKVWFESAENKGTTFYITIPLKGMKSKKGVTELLS